MALDATLVAVVRIIEGDPDFDVRIDGRGESGSSIGWATDSGNIRISRLGIARQGVDEQRLDTDGAALTERIFGNRSLRLQFTCDTNAQTWENTAEEMADDLRAGLCREDVAAMLEAEDLGQPRCTEVRSVSYRDDHGDWRSAAIFEAAFPWSRVHRPAAGVTLDRICAVEYTGDVDGHALGPEIVPEDYMAFNTQHFNIGRIGSPTVAPTPGTPDVDALAVFGQMHTASARAISVIHLHGIQDLGSGSLTIEVFRRRAGAMTLLGSGTLTGGSGDYATVSITPSDAALVADDYLFAQVTALAGSGGYDGLTVDAHFA